MSLQQQFYLFNFSHVKYMNKFQIIFLYLINVTAALTLGAKFSESLRKKKRLFIFNTQTREPHISESPKSFYDYNSKNKKMQTALDVH